MRTKGLSGAICALFPCYTGFKTLKATQQISSSYTWRRFDEVCATAYPQEALPSAKSLGLRRPDADDKDQPFKRGNDGNGHGQARYLRFADLL